MGSGRGVGERGSVREKNITRPFPSGHVGISIYCLRFLPLAKPPLETPDSRKLHAPSSGLSLATDLAISVRLASVSVGLASV